MSIQPYLKAQYTFQQSIEQYETYLKQNKGYNFLVKQTEGISLPFIEAIGIGISLVWISSLGILPPVFLVFTEPILAFGFAVLLLIPINLLLTLKIKNYKHQVLQQGNIVNNTLAYFHEKSKFWDSVFQHDPTKRVFPSKEEIIDIITQEDSLVLMESPLGITTQYENGIKMKIEETPIAFDVFGKLLAIEFDVTTPKKGIFRLFVSHPFIFKCNKGSFIKRNLLPKHSQALQILREVTNTISKNQRSHIINSNGRIGIIFEDIISPSKNNLKSYMSLPRLIHKVQNIFQ